MGVKQNRPTTSIEMERQLIARRWSHSLLAVLASLMAVITWLWYLDTGKE